MAVSITLKGREVPLLYTTEEMLTIQEEIGPVHETITKASGANPEDSKDTSLFGTKEHLKTLAKLIVLLGNAGLEENDQEGDLTEKKVLRGIKPDEIYLAVSACMQCLTEGMMSEIPDDIEKKAQSGPVDVTLEEIKKKDGTES